MYNSPPPMSEAILKKQMATKIALSEVGKKETSMKDSQRRIIEMALAKKKGQKK